ncbi:MAG: hypothetical protein E7L01_22325 [Paenibacillus macerans]|uniref:Uncharacterized protein n=1 Tax=Paenibacillus macerans TaxID=44252 RepID=A0A090ZGW4_PAEMA|nr:hypothetical protein [Paenibacillus macerans]KFN10559.1 hypothetical protein DJ90_1055 [Paenibacillus macerans]MBS5912261.1 hypothetical protein [Paenibacillus macerans]MCY7557117.1 hypothetical protein [Paenibacillus macerans]MDU7476046.1 hypothetical protein [Paenibacillus macerans]MEC0138515.1 hypothetical protein [Paenibacillus macerans]
MKKHSFVSGDKYSRWFARPVGDTEKLVIVDGQVWDQVVSSVPSDYRLPDPVTIQVLEQALRELDANVKDN